MQRYELTVDKFLDHAARWSGTHEIVTADAGKAVSRVNYADTRDRCNRLSGALQQLNLSMGDRVATLAWNTQHHFEMYYASMGAGYVCHTLNPRFTPAQLVAVIREAGDRVLAVTADLLSLASALVSRCPSIENLIVVDGDGSSPDFQDAENNCQVWTLDSLLEDKGQHTAWGNFEEDASAGLCYTSGTTGKPKGVVYSHRSNYLHTLRALQADSMAISHSDALLVAVPMFHANGWGLPFAAPAVGAKLVLPGRHTDGASLARLMRTENVTIAAGVHTVWLGLVDHLDATGEALPDLKRLIIGGSKCPDALIERMEQRLDCQVQTSWGMTELSPLGTIMEPGISPTGNRASGRPVLGLDLKLTDADGVTLDSQRGSQGHLWIKGASVIDRYYRNDDEILDEDGYFDSGDLAVIDEAGNLSINGRSKDLIKSGGEWINPAEIEEIVGRHPAVGQVAVIGQADDKWGERPVLVVQPNSGHALDEGAILELLQGKVAKWWIPDQIVRVPSMPLAATGKIDKNQLRARFARGGSASELAGG